MRKKKTKETPEKKVIKEKKINKEKDKIAETIQDSEEIYGIVVGDEDEKE